MTLYTPANFERAGVIAGFTITFSEAAGLVVSLTTGVLFAQGTIYRPVLAPAVAAAPASQQSWLYYNTESGFYWQSAPTPAAVDDAFIGWVVCDDEKIVAASTQAFNVGEAVPSTGGGSAGGGQTAAAGGGDWDRAVFGIGINGTLSVGVWSPRHEVMVASATLMETRASLESAADGIVLASIWNNLGAKMQDIAIPSGSTAGVTVTTFLASGVAKGNWLKARCDQIGPTVPGGGLVIKTTYLINER